MVIGMIILSFGYYNIHSQSMISEGGVLGLSLLISYWFNISPGIISIIIDLLAYFFAYLVLGSSFLKKALFCSCIYSLFYIINENIGYILPDLSNTPFWASIFGAIFVGIGVGLVVVGGGACAGDDAIALSFNKITNINLSISYLITDIIVLVLSLSYLDIINVLFSILSVSISSLIIGQIFKYSCHK